MEIKDKEDATEVVRTVHEVLKKQMDMRSLKKKIDQEGQEGKSTCYVSVNGYHKSWGTSVKRKI